MSRLPFIKAFTLATALSASALAEVPSVVVQDALASARGYNDGSPSQLAVLTALSQDERPQVRLAAAESLMTGELEGFSKFEPLLKELVSDSSPAVQSAASAALARNVAAMPTFDRAIVLSGWATDPCPALREASALALANEFFVPSSDVMLEHLLEDSQAKVRQKAVQAVKVRYANNGQVVAHLLEDTLLDADTQVRRSARRAVAQAMAI